MALNASVVPRRRWSVHQLGISPRSRASCVLRTNWTKFQCPWLCHSVSQVGPWRYGGSVVPGRPALATAAAPSATRRMGHGGSPCPMLPYDSSNHSWSRSTVRRRPPSASGSRRYWPLRPPSTLVCGGIRGDTPGRRRNRFVGLRPLVASSAQLLRGPSYPWAPHRDNSASASAQLLLPCGLPAALGSYNRGYVRLTRAAGRAPK